MESSNDKKAQVSEEQLLLRYTQGDSGAFEQLVRRYRLQLFHFLARFVGDRTLAEDIFQETFLQVHLSAKGFDASRRLKPWLYTIAANKARDALRSRLRRPMAELDAHMGSEDGEQRRYLDLMPAGIASPGQTLENREAAAGVKRVVEQMPENLREVLLLAYFEEFAYRDIAEILAIPLGTVKSRLHVAVKDFARRWKAIQGEHEDES